MDMAETVQRGQGAVLMAQLRTAAGEVSALLTRLGHVRTGPPITSMDRRRLADQADLSTASLDRVCADLDAWVASLDQTVANEPIPVTVDPAPSQKDVPAAPATDPADLSGAQQAVDQARAELNEAVEGAREGGASWREIGAALGIAGQTAHKRFDPGARQRHAEYMRTRYRRLSSG